MYFMDRSKQKNRCTGCAFLDVVNGQIINASSLRLSDDATVFSAEMLAIKAAVADTCKRDFSEIDVYSDCRSVLDVLHSLVPKHRAVAEITSLVKDSGINLIAHWIKTHIGHPGNERVDELAKVTTCNDMIDLPVKLTT